MISGLIANPRTSQGMVRRLKVAQMACAGATNELIAKELGLSLPSVRKWRGRFSRSGLAGLRDLPRPGKPPTYKEDFRLRVLQCLELPPPKGQATWDGPAVARHLGASNDAVWRVLLMIGWRNTTDESTSTLHQPRPVGLTRSRSGLASSAARLCEGPVSRTKTSCARPSKPSSTAPIRIPVPLSGGNAKFAVLSLEIR